MIPLTWLVHNRGQVDIEQFGVGSGVSWGWAKGKAVERGERGEREERGERGEREERGERGERGDRGERGGVG